MNTFGCKYYMYEFGNGIILYNYISHVLEQVLMLLKITDITNLWSRHRLAALLREGDWIECQGAFYFQNPKGKHEGKHQIARAYRQAKGITLKFVYNSWECTSSSSKWERMSGKRVSTIIGQVTSIEVETTRLTINVSCLAAGSHLRRDKSLSLNWPAEYYGAKSQENF